MSRPDIQPPSEHVHSEITHIAKTAFPTLNHGNSMDSQAPFLILHSSPMSNQSPCPTNWLFSVPAIGSTGLSSPHRHYFSIAAVTNYCKFKGLIRHTQLTLQFYRSKIQHQSHQSTIKVQAFLSGSFSRESISLSFQLLETTHIPWLMAPSSSIFKATNKTSLWPISISHPFLTTARKGSPLLRTYVIRLRSLGYSRIISAPEGSYFFITPTKSLLP